MAIARLATFSGLTTLALLSTACHPPDSIRLDGPAPSTVWAGLPVILPPVTVVDAEGRPVPNTYIDISVHPPSKARIEGRRLIAVHHGTAELQWHVAGSPVVKRVPIEVRIPDDIDIECPGGNCNIRIGDRLVLSARARRGDSVFDHAPILWTSSAPQTLAPERPGEFIGRAPGPASISAHLGTLTRTVTMRVSSDEVDTIKLDCQSDGTAKRGKNDDACVVHLGHYRAIDARLFGHGYPAFGFEKTWTSGDDEIVRVTENKLIGQRLGQTVVAVEAGGARAELAVEVWPPACREKVQEVLTYIIPGRRRYMGRRRVSLACRVPGAESCIKFYRDQQDQTYPEAFESCCCVATLR